MPYLFVASPVPNYARNTVSSHVRQEGLDNKLHTPLPNIGDSFSDHIYSDSDLSASMDNIAQAKVKLIYSPVFFSFHHSLNTVNRFNLVTSK